jgi:hypothetical protein
MIKQYPFPTLTRCTAPISALSLDTDFASSWRKDPDKAQPPPAIAALLGGRRPRRTSSARARLRAVDAPTRLTLDGQKVVATSRFWRSLSVRCGLNESIFRYFEPDEVFTRISERSGARKLRFTIEHPHKGDPKLLGVTDEGAPIIDLDGARALVSAHGGEKVTYQDGRITSMHVPGTGPGRFRIGPDEFENRFSLDLPLDGLGEPRIFTTLLRLVCLNGAVAHKPAFQSDVRLGNDPWHALDRALCSYADADGFSAMRQRFEAAQRSWASLEEVRALEQVLSGMTWGGEQGGGQRRSAFQRMVGDLPGIYGVASLDGISPKRRRLLPSRSRVYDLINFASELSTHHATPAGVLKINSWIGSIICAEYDLEGSAQEVSDFEALFMASPKAPAGAMAGAPEGAGAARGTGSGAAPVRPGARKGTIWRSSRN